LRNNLIDEAKTKCLWRADHIGREQYLHRRPLADEPGQALAAAISGNDPQFHFWLAQHGVLRGDSKCAGHCELASAAECIAIDRSNDGFPEPFDVIEHSLSGEGIFPAFD